MQPAFAPEPGSPHRPGRYRVIGILILLIFLRPAFAAPVQYHIDSWTTENGLPQNVIRDMCQTPDGYLWLATLDGMVRFDGARFVVFNRSNTPGIEGNRFTSLYCTANGEFWAGTESSGITQYSQGKFTTYTVGQGLPANDVPAVIGDDAGHIWALSHTSIVQWSKGGFQVMELPPEESKCSYFPIGRPGFWCIEGNSLHLFIRGQFLHYPLPADWPQQVSTRAGRDLSGAIWLADGNARFAKLSGGEWSKILEAHTEQGASSKWADPTSMYQDSRGNHWEISVGSDSGAFLLQALNLSLHGKPEKIVFNSFFEDREGSIWLATDGQGLYQLRQQTVTTLSKEDGLPDRNVYPIYQDREGAIWIGTWNGGLARFSDGKLTAISIAGRPTSNRISSISEDLEGVLWVATSTSLYRRQSENFQLVRDSIPGGGQGVRAIHQDPEGTLWLGTDHGLLQLKSGVWSLLRTADGLATDDVRVIINSRAGNLWIGGYGGLTSLDHGEFKHWTEANGLPSNSIRSLYEDPDGVLWIGTYDGGLGRFQDGRFTRFTVRDGLFNNGVFQILEDSRGYLWMSSNRGIYRVSKGELNELAAGKRTAIFSTVYGKSEGMRNAECNGGLSPAGFRARDGKLWFPTQDGVAIVDPEAVTTNPVPPPVVIESISLDRKLQPLDRPIRVSPGSENLEIEYTALSLIDSEQIRFKYQLTGLDRNWVDAYTRRTAYYSHLPPGSYDFRVIAANSDGVWNMAGTGVRISVLPRFYQTWWFILLVSVTVLGAVYIAWQNRVSQFEHAKEVQRAFSRQLIASQENERKRIASEMHDSLGQHLLIIKNWATLALRGLNEATSAREPLDEISTTASLAIDEVRGIAYQLRPYQLEKLGLTTAIQDLVSRVAASSSIHFTCEVDSVDGDFPKDVEIGIYRIVQEGLNNTVRHSQATEARVLIKRTAEWVKVTIQDNGRGFTPPDGRAAQSGWGGFGLLGIAERVRMLDGLVVIQSAPGAGTTISISLKAQEGSG